MTGKDDLQKAISVASKSGLAPAVARAFERTELGWQPRSDCLISYYSTSEAVLCSVLICYFFELYGSCPQVIVPPGRDFTNSAANLIWPGAWFFYSAVCRLSDRTSWDALIKLFPGR